MEAILIIIVKALAGGFFSHYLRKGLASLDEHLLELLESGEDTNIIEAYVKEKGLEQKIANFAGETLSNSVVIPLLSEKDATVEDRAEFFLSILKVAYNASASLKMDLLLPGSILGPDVFSLFERNVENVSSQLVRDGVEIDIEGAANSIIENRLYVFPIKDESEKTQFWGRYKHAVRNRRQETLGYLSAKELLPSLKPLIDNCNISRVTAGSCYYMHAIIMDKENRELLGVENGSAPIVDWFGGIEAMLHGIQEVEGLTLLSPEEIKKILSILDRLR